MTPELVECADNLPAMICEYRPDGTLVFVNRAYCEFFGASREELQGTSFLDLLPEEEREAARRHIESLTPENPTTHHVHKVESPTGVRWQEWRDSVVFDDEGNPVLYRAIGNDITELREAQESSARQSRIQETLLEMASRYINVPFDEVRRTIEDALRAIGETIHADGVYIYEYDFESRMMRNTHEWVSPGTRTIRPEDRAVPMDLLPDWIAEHTAGRAIIADRLEAMPEGPEKELFQSYGVRSVMAFPMMSKTECLGFVGFDSVREDFVPGAEERFLCALFTEMQTSILLRSRAENTIQELLREKEMLLTETHHRVKNNFTTIVSLLSLQQQTLEDHSARSAIQDAASRVRSMMVLYEKLYRSPLQNHMDIARYLPALVEEILDLYKGVETVTSRIEVDDILLEGKVLASIGILVNELICNSMKHAFGGVSNATIELTVKHNDASLDLEYRDNGVGLPDGVAAGTTAGLGMQLVHSMAQDLGGTVAVDSPAGDGARFRLVIPIP